MALLIKNIGLLVNVREDNTVLRGADLSHLPCIKNAYLIIKNGKIKEYGSKEQLSLLTTHHSPLTMLDAKDEIGFVKIRFAFLPTVILPTVFSNCIA